MTLIEDKQIEKIEGYGDFLDKNALKFVKSLNGIKEIRFNRLDGLVYIQICTDRAQRMFFTYAFDWKVVFENRVNWKREGF